MTWEAAESAWSKFLHDVEAAQAELGCTWSNAWFRGLDDANYALLPSLLRLSWVDIPSEERQDKRLLPSSGHFRSKEFRLTANTRKRLRKRLHALRTKPDAQEQEAVQAEYEMLKARERALKAEANERAVYRSLLRSGERDAFISYQFQSGSEAKNSWQVLAEMQHVGTPTRLLDWTDVLSSALYFALRHVRRRIEKYWFDVRTQQVSAPGLIGFPPLELISTLPEPSIWIVNPYRLSRVATQRNRIWDLTLDPALDYYQRFIERKEWEFDFPIPIYSPWRSPRIAAQRGMFLVWGYDQRALDEILHDAGGPPVLKQVNISKLAAIQAVKHMRQLSGVDRFAMYRDLDALGGRVRREFLHDPNDREEHFE